MGGSGSFGHVYLVKGNWNGDAMAMKVLNKHDQFAQKLIKYTKAEPTFCHMSGILTF